ncbi:hypothetical protein [Chryseobacterium wangxinyae]|uniref:hypothetical protein n=1 Tax=Chryseobacterium sp. CY353 TaxID=2997334 RepID=UPI00226FA28B|nr:hypothetical protein [Chryseobacterium sp. CY353]MCY0968747.1 hypothetical protein [Chryseobacterium sp. CY353]
MKQDIEWIIPLLDRVELLISFYKINQGTQEINFTYFLTTTFAIIHTHFDKLHDPIFSPGDIIQFNEWLYKAKLWNDNPANIPKIYLKKLSFTLVTSWGNYMLTFDGTDVNLFSGYDIENLNNIYIKSIVPALTF